MPPNRWCCLLQNRYHYPVFQDSIAGNKSSQLTCDRVFCSDSFSICQNVSTFTHADSTHAAAAHRLISCRTKTLVVLLYARSTININIDTVSMYQGYQVSHTACKDGFLTKSSISQLMFTLFHARAVLYSSNANRTYHNSNSTRRLPLQLPTRSVHRNASAPVRRLHEASLLSGVIIVVLGIVMPASAAVPAPAGGVVRPPPRPENHRKSRRKAPPPLPPPTTTGRARCVCGTSSKKSVAALGDAT